MTKEKEAKSVRTQITTMSMVIVMISLMMAGVSFFLVEKYSHKQIMNEEAQTLAKVFAEHMAASLFFDDEVSAARVLNALGRAGSVVQACVYTTKGTLFASYLGMRDSACQNKLGDIDNDANYISALAVSERNGVQAGTIYLQTHVTRLNQISWYSAFLMVIIGMLTLLLALPLSRRFQKSISQPILELAEISNQISMADLQSAYPAENAAKEIVTLYQSFSAMLIRMHEEEIKLSDSEHLLHSIVDNSSTIIHVKDLDGRYTFVNKVFERVMSLNRDAVLNKTDHQIYPASLADQFKISDNKVMETKQPYKYDEVMKLNDGEHIYMAIKFPLLNADSSINAVCGIFTDISDRIKMEKALKESQQRLWLYREQSPLAVIEWDKNFRVVNWNPAATKIFGYHRDEAINHYCKHLLFSDENEFQKLESALTTNSSEIGVYLTNNNNEGKTIYCKWISTPVVDDRGVVMGITSLIEDVTVQKQQEEQLRRGQKLDALGNLTSGIAHDFNNMLSIVMGFARLLKQREDDPEKLNLVDEIYYAAAHSADLTRKLSVFSTNVKSEPEPVDINVLLWRGQNMLQKTLTSRIELVMELSDDLWSVWLDSGELEDAILNISINAMHAMPDAGKYTIASSNVVIDKLLSSRLGIKEGEYVMLSFTDTGHGMDAATVEHIFEPFFTTKGDKGTGLGLSQVYGFTRKSRGAVSVTSVVGQGTRFELYFPRYTKIPKQKQAPVTDPQPLLRGDETILVVDDVALIRRLNEIVLSNNGYHVLSAGSAEEALALLANEKVDLLITDISMPNMDGYQLVEIAQSRCPNLKVLIVSGFQETKYATVGDAKNELDYLQKPSTPEALLIKIRKVLDGEN